MGAIQQLISSFAGATDIYGPELVTNGGFDSDLSGYFNTNYTITWNSGIVDFDAPNGGYGFFRTGQVPVDAGSEYLFSFKAKRGTVPSLKYSIWSDGDIIGPTPYTVGTSDFETFSVQFTVPAGKTWVMLYPARDILVAGTAFFDDLSLKEVL